MTDPKQLAREMAEKCGDLIEIYLSSCPLSADKAGIVQAILDCRELNLEQLIADKQRLEKLIEEVKTYSTQAADFMEGEGMPQFQIYEDQMMWAVEVLKRIGLIFDPLTGKCQAIDNAIKSQS